MKNDPLEYATTSHDEYVRLIDKANETELLNIATKRMNMYKPSTVIDAGNLYKELGITQEDIDAIGNVEFE